MPYNLKKSHAYVNKLFISFKYLIVTWYNISSK